MCIPCISWHTTKADLKGQNYGESHARLSAAFRSKDASALVLAHYLVALAEPIQHVDMLCVKFYNGDDIARLRL